MDKKLYQSMFALSVVEMVIGLYMTIYKLTSNDSLCLGSGDCSTVNASPYSSVFGIPVATIGLIGALLIFTTLILENRGGKFFKQNATMIIFGLCVTGFAFNVYLIYLEFFIIKALCPFCVASQITMTLLFVLSLIRVIRQPVN